MVVTLFEGAHMILIYANTLEKMKSLKIPKG